MKYQIQCRTTRNGVSGGWANVGDPHDDPQVAADDVIGRREATYIGKTQNKHIQDYRLIAVAVLKVWPQEEPQ